MSIDIDASKVVDLSRLGVEGLRLNLGLECLRQSKAG